MNRREFLQNLLASSFVSPFILNQKFEYPNWELYLLSDQPHRDLPPLLSELKRLNIFPGRGFAFSDFHPQQNELASLLTKEGLILTSDKKAEIKINFLHLLNPASASFTFIHEGRIRDLRSAHLYSLWERMQARPKTNSLTRLSSVPSSLALQPGKNLLVRVEGKVIEKLPLDQSIRRTIDTGFGRVTFQVRDGRAWVEDSTCRHKVCLSSLPIKYPHERIICAPNHFLIEVEGRSWLDTLIG